VRSTSRNSNLRASVSENEHCGERCLGFAEVTRSLLYDLSVCLCEPSAATSKSTSKQDERAATEAALAAAEASATYRPRVEWSTESTDHQQTEVFCATWSPDSRFLAVGCGDGSIRVFNAATGKIAYLLRSSAAMALGGSSSSGVDESLPITCIRFRPSDSSAKTKNVLLATCADGSITHWHMMTQTCLYSIQEKQDTTDSQVYACDYRSDGEQFATGGRDGRVRLYDESTKALTATLTAGRDKGTTGHSNRIYVVKYHPKDSNLLVSGGWDNTVQIWDCRAGHSIRSIYGPHLCGDALDLSPDGHTILTGSWRPNDTLQRWDFATGRLLDSVPFACGPGGLGADRPELLYAAAFSPDGSMFAAGGCGTNESKIFTNTTPAKAVERISAGAGGVYCVAFAPSGKKLAMGGGASHVTVIDL
jgi:COMPASS component SWD3